MDFSLLTPIKKKTKDLFYEHIKVMQSPKAKQKPYYNSSKDI
jgi:hypothetical protein